MDDLIIALKDIMNNVDYHHGAKSFQKSKKLVDFCIEKGKIADISIPQKIPEQNRKIYLNHLVNLTKNFFANHNDIFTWNDFRNHSKNKKIHSILHNFGVPGEIHLPDNKDNCSGKSKTSLTITEFYEIAKMKFNFQGTENAFKRHIQKLYGSYAEYCIQKGYDVNSCFWDCEETALRCAKKLGGLEQVKKRSKSLYHFLEKNNLLEKLQ